MISSSRGSFSAPKTPISRQTSSMLFSRSRMLCGVAAAVGLELVEVEPLQQLAVDAQLQVGHDRAEMGFQLAAGDGGGLLGLEGQRVGPDADLGARLEHAPSARPAPPRRPPRNYSGRRSPVAACRRPARTTACCRETSGLCRHTVLAGSRPMVTSASATSTTMRRLSLILLNQIFMLHAGKKGTVPICRNGPRPTFGRCPASHKWGLSPFSLRVCLCFGCAA